MMRIAFLPSLCACLLLSLSATPARAQEAENDDGSLVSVADLVFDRYVAQNGNASQLAQTLISLVGRDYFVREHGAGAPPIRNVHRLSDGIVLYDTREQVQRALALLQKLDVPPSSETSRFTSMEYRPRFLSLVAASEALQSMVSVEVPVGRDVLVLKGDEAELAAAERYIKGVDVPQKQVLLSCFLLEVGQGDADAAVPKELLDNLRQLLPGSEFSLAGMALLKTSVAARRALSLQIESPGKRYQFSFSPEAFDPESGSLTVTGCRLTEESGSGARLLFETSTVLRGGEYTVLAATGATTRLLVVRILPQD